MSEVEPALAPAAGHEPGFRVWSLAYYTIPFHVVAPVLIAWAGSEHVDLVSKAWLAVHLLFPIVLVLSYPWWQGQGQQVLGLLAVNHLASFATIIALAVALS